MNNTLCLGVFLLVIYRQRLPWVWSSEVACIVGARRRAAGPAGGAPDGCLPAARRTLLWRLSGIEAALVVGVGSLCRTAAHGLGATAA